jgi:hypothetical protein
MGLTKVTARLAGLRDSRKAFGLLFRVTPADQPLRGLPAIPLD